MIAPRFIPLVLKYIVRHRARSVLTLLGVATAMFLFYAVQAMRSGVETATRATAEDATLVVYRENRFCPFASQLPQDYARAIERIPGVKAVVPMKIVVNNCRASLDIVTFRGVPDEAFDTSFFEGMKLVSGSIADWKLRTDAAILGDRLAERRGLKVGDRLDVAGFVVTVAGVLQSNAAQDENVAYVHLGFLQRSAAKNNEGIVTQFNVRVTDPSLLDSVAAAIDAEFATAQAPTWTASEKTFVARAISDIVDLVRFAGWLGWGSLAAVFALVANAVILSVQDRIKDHAVMQTLGFREGLIARLIVLEGLLLSLVGGVVGLALAAAVSLWGRFTFSVEGNSVSIEAGLPTVLFGIALCAAVGVLAGLVPAWRATRMETGQCFRAV